MRKVILLSAVALTMLACNKETPSAEKMKTAYIDTSKLLEEFPNAEDFSVTYSDYKDLNDYLKSKNNLKNNFANDVDENRNPEQTNNYRRKR